MYSYECINYELKIKAILVFLVSVIPAYTGIQCLLFSLSSRRNPNPFVSVCFRHCEARSNPASPSFPSIIVGNPAFLFFLTFHN